MGWYREHTGRWKVRGVPYVSSPNSGQGHDEVYYDNGWRLDTQGQKDVVTGLFVLFGLWIVVGMAYIFIADYTWTTAAVVLGVLVLFSLFTVGIMRTGGIILRFIWWAILMAVMTDVEVRVGGSFTNNMHGVLLPGLAAVLIFAVWLYSTVKITRLVF